MGRFVRKSDLEDGFAVLCLADLYGYCTARVADLRELLPEAVAIEVDGGIGVATLAGVRDAGATLFVSASSIFGADDPVAAYSELAVMAAGA